MAELLFVLTVNEGTSTLEKNMELSELQLEKWDVHKCYKWMQKMFVAAKL